MSRHLRAQRKRTSPRKVESQKKTPVPYCSYKAKNQTKVRTFSRAGVKGFDGNKAYLRCGSYTNTKTGQSAWGLRHIGEKHKNDWANKAGGSDWFDMMEFATKSTLKKPESAVRSGQDTYGYCAPVELKYNGKIYDRFKTVAPVSHQGKNVITSSPVKKCK